MKVLRTNFRKSSRNSSQSNLQNNSQRNSQSDPRNNSRKNISLPIKKAVRGAIIPLRMQSDEVVEGWERLSMQVERINAMAAELEEAILELKAIASTLNGYRRYGRGKQNNVEKVCKYFPVSIPWLKQRKNRTFILTSRKIDLFRSEREANLLAQKLRSKNKRKRNSSQRHKKDKNKGGNSSQGIVLRTSRLY